MMRILRLNTVSHKLLAIVMLTTLVALIVALGALVSYNLHNYHINLISDMATQSELLGRMTAPALNFDDQNLAKQNLDLLRLRPKVRAAAIYNADGRLFASYAAPGEKLDLPKALEGNVERTEGGYLHVFKRIEHENEIIGTVYLRSDYEFYGRLLTHLGIAVAAIAIAMMIAFFLSIRLQRVVSDPIRSIAQIAREVVEQRDYSRRAEKISSDEVGVLVDSFNGMLAEIERRTQALEQSNQEIAREVGERRLVQQEVMRLNAELEERVRERTAQLEASNVELEQARANAEHANQAKSAFLSSMSHELRTPLNAVLGFAQLLQAQAEKVTPERISDFASHILKAGQHLLTLINEVLDLAKIESGSMTFSMEAVALHEVLRECHELVAPMAEQRNIYLMLPEDQRLYVLADRVRLKQVLLNLLSNAIKYNRASGMVTVSIDDKGAEQICIFVRDEGAGLTEEQIQQLFQPFNRLGQEAGREEGTGIGLVVTKRLTELMSGRISVKSSIGQGSEFCIELKRPIEADRAAEEQVRHIVATPKIYPADRPLHTMLYVEDNPVNLKLVQEVLALRADVRLLTAADGSMGIELARAHQPDVILLDINLPGIGGNAVLGLLRRDEKTRHIPVIAVTANAMPRDIEKGLALGFFRYVTKPINVQELLDTIDSAIDLVDSRQSPVAAKKA